MRFLPWLDSQYTHQVVVALVQAQHKYLKEIAMLKAATRIKSFFVEAQIQQTLII